MCRINFKNVSKTYKNNVEAIKNFNLEIFDKEFLVLVGPSGCGKSTLLRMIAGLEEISSGEIIIDGVVVNEIPPKERDIAMVFQNYALYPHMTVFENMAFGLKLRNFKKSEINERVLEAAEILDLNKLLNRKPSELSGGQRQRVALGRAIVRKPKLFLFDEPLSNLDAKLRVHMRSEISKLHQKLKTTIVYVTHDQVEALTMGSRVVVLKDGVIEQIDKPLDLYNYPKTKFSAEFIGSPKINFIDGQIIKEKKNYFFVDNNKNLKIDFTNKINKQIKKCSIAIRAENINLISQSSNKKNKLIGFVEAVEQFGNEQIIYFTFCNNIHLSMRLTSSTQNLSIGSKFLFLFDIEKIHLFSETGFRLN